METQLTGLVVLITGASGGIGRAVAEAFAAEGASLALHAGAQLADLESYVSDRPWARQAACFAADVRKPEAVSGMFESALARFGRVDVCVAAAGIWPSEYRRLHQMAPARVRDVLEVNLMGAMWTARGFLAGLARAGARADGRGSSLCLVGSTAGRFGEAGHAEYAASKAGLRGLVSSLKNEIVHLDPYGRVNMVEPGWTVTPMAGPSLDNPDVLPGVLATMPLRQLARPEDVARTIVFLSSPALSRHTTGEVLTIAGGMEGRRLWRPEEIDPMAVRKRLEQS